MSDDISRFKRAFGYGGDDVSNSGTEAPGIDCLAASKAWPGTVQSITSQLARLRAALLVDYTDEGVAADIARRFDAKIAPITDMLDNRFSAAMSALTEAAGTADATKLGGETRTLVGTYTALLNDATWIDMDDNPFVPLTIRDELSSLLAKVPKSLQAA